MWYAQGLNFQCTACGACCSGAGIVRMSVKDILLLAKHTQRSEEDFVDTYLERKKGSWILKQNLHNGDCIFLEEHRCSIYEARPTQCRTFPWWPTVLTSADKWKDTARLCEGIEVEPTTHHSWQEIQSILRIEKADRKQR